MHACRESSNGPQPGRCPGPAKAWIGTAGWSIPRQHAADFPAEGSHLERYGAVFTAVEINSSFYRPHRTATYERWRDAVPEDFRFSVKLPKAITHERRLEGVEDLVGRFLSEVAGLGPKLGPVLVQLPPSLAFVRSIAEPFLNDLRQRITSGIAFEPRHSTWFTPEVDGLLAELEIARVAADPAPAPGAGEPGGWTGLRYYRLHGSPRIYYSPYEPSFLDAAAERVADDLARGVVTWCIFDNTAAFAATGDALAVRRRVDSRR